MPVRPRDPAPAATIVAGVVSVTPTGPPTISAPAATIPTATPAAAVPAAAEMTPTKATTAEMTPTKATAAEMTTTKATTAEMTTTTTVTERKCSARHGDGNSQRQRSANRKPLHVSSSSPRSTATPGRLDNPMFGEN
jgi:hypothetical protein